MEQPYPSWLPGRLARPLAALLLVALALLRPLGASAQYIVSTLAGSGTSGSADGAGSAAQFTLPAGVAVDGAGNVYVADYGNNRIRKVSPAGVVTTLAGSSQGYADGTGSAAQFYNPTGVAVDGAGNVYVADYGNYRIRKVSPAGVVTTLAGSSTSGFADGTGSAAQFTSPSGVAVDGAGTVYVADQSNNRIRKVSPAGVVTTLAGSSTSGFADGTGSAAQFTSPSGVAVDGAGTVYVADQSNNRIRKVSPAGVVTTLAGSSQGYADGTGSAAQFYNPTGVAVDGAGNVYVADYGNYRIRKVSPAGVVTTLAGSGRLGYADGTASAARFTFPRSVAVDGNVYVADYGNYRIRKVALAAPTLTSISPNPAPVGTSVTLTGTDLTGATAVTFNGTSNNTVTTGLTVGGAGSSQTLTVVVPAGATSGPVTVTTPGGTSNGVAFTVTTSAPVLATIETSVVAYAGGQAPAQVTGTLTVSDADSPTLSGATVAIGSGFMLGDNLLFTNQNGITGAYASNTGVLTLSGAASVAAYQAALRSVTFSTLASSSGVAGDRVVSFSVSDGTNASNQVARTVRVVGQPAVSTATPSGVTSTSAVLGGTVTADGGDAMTDRGVVYSSSSTAATLIIGGAGVTQDANGTSTGSYSKTIAGLAPGTSYYVRAYATNTVGTSYGIIQTFTTLAAPTTVVSLNRADASPTNAGSVTYTLTFAAPVTGLSSSNFSLTTTGSVAGASLTSVSGAGTTYTVAVNTGTGDGTLTLTLANATGLTPSVSNVPFAGQAYTLDKTAPTATIMSPTAANSTSSATSFTYTVTFSESVTGFAAGSVAVTNGSLVGFAGSGTTYTFSVTPGGSGAVTVSVPANGAQDAASNGNTAAAPYTITYAPTLTTWTGTTNTDWFTASNWTAGVPTATLDVTIPTSPSGGRFPLITFATPAANARNLTINSGATLTQTTGTLVLAANLTNNGTFLATSGTVLLGNTALSNVFGSSNTRFWNLTVGPSGAQQSTSASTSVQRQLNLNGGTFATNGNPFTLESNATNTALVVNNGSGVVSGTVTVQRYIAPDLNPNLGYRHVSAPISNATVASLATGSFAPVVNPAYNTAAAPGQVQAFPTVYGYDQSRLASTTNNLPPFDKGWYSPAALSDPLIVGQGYTVNLAAGQTWNFTGTLNNDFISQTLARNSGATAADAGLHLVGNPYPSPLDVSQIAAADRVNLDQFVAVWASNNPANPYAGVYTYYNNGLGTAGPVVAVGQGFFTRVTPGQTSGTLTFRNSQRVTSYQSPTYHRPAETRPVVQLGLQATGGSDVDNAFVYFEQGATAAFDSPFDAPKLANPSGLNLSSSFAGSERLALNGLSPLSTSQVVVPLQVGVPAAGSYTLSAQQLLNLPTTSVYLRDLQTGALIDLAQQPTYQFTVSNASALLTGRFELVFSPQRVLATAPAALVQQVGLYPNPAKTTAFLELPASLGRQTVTATLVDALGRVVRTVTLPAQGTQAHQLDLQQLATGVYALRLTTSAGSIVKRLTVE